MSFPSRVRAPLAAGFSLIEVIIAIVVGSLIGVIFFNYTGTQFAPTTSGR